MAETNEFMGGYFEAQKAILEEQKEVLNDSKQATENLSADMLALSNNSTEQIAKLDEVISSIMASASQMMTNSVGTDILFERAESAWTTSYNSRRTHTYISKLKGNIKLKMLQKVNSISEGSGYWKIYVKVNGTIVNTINSKAHSSVGNTYSDTVTLSAIEVGDEVQVEYWSEYSGQVCNMTPTNQFVGNLIDGIVG